MLGEYNDPLSLHLYTYVKSNPLTYVDPTGHVGKALIENNQGARDDWYLAASLFALEKSEIQNVKLSGEAPHLTMSVIDTAKQLGIDRDLVQAVAFLIYGPQGAHHAKLRDEAYLVQQSLVALGYDPGSACGTGCKIALSTVDEDLGDFRYDSASAYTASAMAQMSGMASTGLQRQIFRYSTLPVPSDFRTANTTEQQPSPGSTSTLNTKQTLEALAKTADQAVPGNGPAKGTLKHSVFRRLVTALGTTTLQTEVTYLGGDLQPYGTKGAVRLDVVERDASGNIVAVYDLKTGSATLTPARIQEIRSNLPAYAQNVPIIEIRP